jgi:hypothetical protein
MKLWNFKADSLDLESTVHFIVEENEYRAFCTIGEDRTFSLNIEVKEEGSYLVTKYYVYGQVQEYVSRTYKVGQLLSLEEVEFLYSELMAVAKDIESGLYEDPERRWRAPGEV